MKIELGPVKIQNSVWSLIALSWGTAATIWAWVFIKAARRGYAPPLSAGPSRHCPPGTEPVAAAPCSTSASKENDEDWI